MRKSQLVTTETKISLPVRLGRTLVKSSDNQSVELPKKRMAPLFIIETMQ